jgi:hypothetical protein
MTAPTTRAACRLPLLRQPRAPRPNVLLREFDHNLSRKIDRAIVQLEAADDPDVRAAWQRVLGDLEAQIPEPEA